MRCRYRLVDGHSQGAVRGNHAQPTACLAVDSLQRAELGDIGLCAVDLCFEINPLLLNSGCVWPNLKSPHCG